MSRRKNLSASASVASCLSFAARVLSSTASVQEVCTKSVLAPMVVEAHRFGQQVMKHVDPGTPADVRKLLRLLQEDESANLKHGCSLEELAVADLTWDFEGTVADTLAMELEELQDRAATASAETCVVLTASSPLSVGRHTVIWFPNEKKQRCRDEDEAHKVIRKYQILLYVCPGRVKVVKDVGDLIKKMYDELPSLRESGATYKVWAVAMASSRAKRVAVSVRKSQPKSNQDEEESCFSSSPVVETSESADSQQRLKSPSGSIRDGSNQEAVDHLPADVKDPLSEVHDDMQDQGNWPLESPRFSVYNGARGATQYPSNSIFTFGLPPRRASDYENLNVEAVLSKVDRVGEERMEGSDVNEECGSDDEAETPVGDQSAAISPRRATVSASLPGVSSETPLQTKPAGVGVGVSVLEGFTWQSCDGKVLRRLVRPLGAADEEKAPGGLDGASSGAQDNCIELDGEDDCETLSESYVNVTDNIELEGHDVAGPDGFAEDVRGNRSDVPASDEAPIAQQQSFDDVTRSTGDNGVPSSILFTFSHGSKSPLADDKPGITVASPLSEPLPLITCGDAGLADAGNETRKPSASEPHRVEIEAPIVCTETVSELLDRPTDDDNDARVRKPKPVPVNYKDKLGARVWFELEYTARRLEKEALLERRQQARRYQGGSFEEGRQTSACGRREGPRRMKPTGWPKSVRQTKQREVRSEDTSSLQQPRSAVDVEPLPKATQTKGLLDAESGSKLLQSEPEPVEMTARQLPSQERSGDRGELTLSYEAIALTKSPKGLDGFAEMHSHADERCENAPLSVDQQHSSDEHHASASLPVPQDGQRSHSVAAELSDRPTISHRLSSESYASRRRLGASIAESVGRVESLTSSSGELSRQGRNKQKDADDQCLAHMMQGSTHSSQFDDTASVSVALNEDKLRARDTVSAVPFTTRGRVPIRSRSSSSRAIISASEEDSSFSGSERRPFSSKSKHDTTTAPSDFSESPADKTSRLQAPRHLQAVAVSPPVATFIALRDDHISTCDNAASTRQERLNDLRQQKLKKLQQTRDRSLQQQKEKRQVHRPLSFANSVYSKKASNRQLIQNALEFTLLAGGSMEKERTLALQALAESTCDNFIVLLKSPKELKFRALYESHVERDCAVRIFSVLSSNSSRAPAKLGSSETISQFFKYSSAKKQFLPVPTRSLTVKTDACALVDQLVFKGKQKNGISALARRLY
jgi:hypothetical protein